MAHSTLIILLFYFIVTCDFSVDCNGVFVIKAAYFVNLYENFKDRLLGAAFSSQFLCVILCVTCLALIKVFFTERRRVIV